MTMRHGMPEMLFRISIKSISGDNVAVQEKEIEKLLETAFPDMHITIKQIDACQVCGGIKGCVPGNENLVGDKVMCDFCYAIFNKKGAKS